MILGINQNSSKEIIPVPSPLSSKTYKRGNCKVLGVGVLKHCIAAGVVARELISKVIPSYVSQWIGTDILSVFPFIVSCHDIGKISTGFQYMIRVDGFIKSGVKVQYWLAVKYGLQVALGTAELSS